MQTFKLSKVWIVSFFNISFNYNDLQFRSHYNVKGVFCVSVCDAILNVLIFRCVLFKAVVLVSRAPTVPHIHVKKAATNKVKLFLSK